MNLSNGFIEPTLQDVISSYIPRNFGKKIRININWGKYSFDHQQQDKTKKRAAILRYDKLVLTALKQLRRLSDLPVRGRTHAGSHAVSKPKDFVYNLNEATI